MITAELIRALGPGITAARAAEVARGLNAAAAPGEINTRLRVAAFIAQLSHESVGFRHLEEIWGPTPAQRRYEGRKDLGNTVRGDGYRFRGRGWIQLTGRHNYRYYGGLLGLPLEAEPDMAALPAVAARIAVAYWGQRGLNTLADVGDFRQITYRINGGYNGWADRERRYRLALSRLPEGAPRVLLVNIGGGLSEWGGRPDMYGGETLTPALISQFRIVYPALGGPFAYGGLKIWNRKNGDMVLERAAPKETK